MWEGRRGDVNSGTRCVPRRFAGVAEAGAGTSGQADYVLGDIGAEEGAGTSAPREFVENAGTGRGYGTRESRKVRSRRGGGGDVRTQENKSQGSVHARIRRASAERMRRQSSEGGLGCVGKRARGARGNTDTGTWSAGEGGTEM